MPFSPSSPSGLTFQTHDSHIISSLEFIPAPLCSCSDSLAPSPEKLHSCLSLCLHASCVFCGGDFFTLLISFFPEFQNLIHLLSFNINIPSSVKTSPKYPRVTSLYLLLSIPQYLWRASNGAHAVKCLVSYSRCIVPSQKAAAWCLVNPVRLAPSISFGI